LRREASEDDPIYTRGYVIGGRKGGLSSIPELPATDPIYTRGYVIGGRSQSPFQPQNITHPIPPR